ncbi:MAG: Holliday junction resolvase RuvX [Gammaproteobacteria bacterium]|nr:Holliday junction resolvase RuvX [Gammaproteobacteria bacterium]
MNESNQTLLGFDFGLKRIGVAVGQSITGTASPLQIVAATQGKPDWEVITKLIATWQPQALVVGIPYTMEDEEQEITHAARRFARRLNHRYHLPVHEVDEKLTTKTAREDIYAKGGYKALQKTAIDSIAAKLILEDWLGG